MTLRGTTRWTNGRAAILAPLLLALFLTVLSAPAQTAPAPVVLDRVVAVVNNQAILASDIGDAIRLAILEPGAGSLTPAQALEQIISQTLIQQQIGREQEMPALPGNSTVHERLDEIRASLPACIRAHCETGEGWTRFLREHGLTDENVLSYLQFRMHLLAFIETRFRAGIRIGAEEVQSYYRDQLLPQYQPGDPIPAFDAVAPRIEEILLQQQVNTLFDGWLANLRKEGDIEAVDSDGDAMLPRNDLPGNER